MNIFEAIMLICFGVGWPVSIVKALRTKVVTGKSPLFMAIVAIGYLSGIMFKITNGVNAIIGLYILNLIMVSFDLFLYYRYLPNKKAVLTK